MATTVASEDLSRLGLAQWQEYVEAHPASTAFHHRNWLDLLAEQYHFPRHIPAVTEGGEIMAAAPFFETRRPWRAKRLISLPFTDSIRVLAADERWVELMLDAVRDEAAGTYGSVVLRTDRPLAGMAPGAYGVRHELSIARTLEEIRARYSSNVRQNLRKAERSRLRFQWRADADAVEAFYRLHLATRKKHGVPIQPKGYFARLARRMLGSGLGFVGLVLKDGAAIAAGVFLAYNKTMIYKYGASDPETLACRPNEYLIDNAIRVACEEGYERLDFGMSRQCDEGLRRFKRKWGAAESPLYHHRLLGRAPASHGDSLALRIGAIAIRHSPAILCRALGEMLYKYSP